MKNQESVEKRMENIEADRVIKALKTETDHIWNQLDEINEKLLKLAEPNKVDTGELEEKKTGGKDMKSISAVIDELTDYFRNVDADGLAGANYICASFIKNPCNSPLGSYLRISFYKDYENLFDHFTRFDKAVADHEQ